MKKTEHPKRMSNQPTKNKIKVPFYLNAGEEVTEIELENSGSDGYNGKWWEKIPDSKEYGTITQSVDAQGGEYDRKSEASGITWLDHHAQAYNDKFRRQSKNDDKDD